MDKYRVRYQLDNLKALFKQYSFKPTPSKVSLINENSSLTGKNFKPNVVKVQWQYRDIIQSKTVNFEKNYLFSESNGKFLDFGLPEEQSNELVFRAESLDGQRKVILKSKSKPDAKSASPEQYIVLYDQKKVLKTIEVKTLNDQLSIVENVGLSSFVLNETGTVLLCVAEVNDKVSKGKEDSPYAKDYDINSHEYRQSWGEKMNTLFHTCIAVIDLELEKLVLIEKSGVSLCDPFFFKSPDKQHFSIGCLGLQELPFKLGLIYCTNRSSFLFGCKLSTDFTEVSPVEAEMYYGEGGALSLHSSRVFHNFSEGYCSKVVFLECDVGGAHEKSARLVQFCFESRKVRIIRDNKDKRPLLPNKTEYSDIGPLFTYSLPVNCFTLDGKFVILHSQTPTTCKAFAVNLEESTLQLIAFPLDYCEILDVKNDWIVAVGSSINRLPNVYITQWDEQHFDSLSWMPVEIETDKVLNNIHFEKFSFPSRDYKDKLVNCIWITPIELVKSEGPTIMLPHGGPHACLPTCYYQSIALYTELGLKICLVNYVGSTGVDEDYVNVLLGNVGTSDVNDFYDAIQYVIKNKYADKDRIILNGGSHGGFMVTSISGQHPELNFLACITRNPVIDIACMSGSTDIPDWTISEALGIQQQRSFSEIYAQTSQEISTMYTVSPIAHVKQVKVPTLLLLGKEDLRVPYSQGLLYHRILKARGIETRCFIYDDVHGLQKINVEFDCFLNMAKFIEKFIYYSS